MKKRAKALLPGVFNYLPWLTIEMPSVRRNWSQNGSKEPVFLRHCLTITAKPADKTLFGFEKVSNLYSEWCDPSPYV